MNFPSKSHSRAVGVVKYWIPRPERWRRCNKWSSIMAPAHSARHLHPGSFITTPTTTILPPSRAPRPLLVKFAARTTRRL
uniref:Uncharacterized protein n=1 Tax=Arundo donax TaxID=35708 RepID=A0A0A9AGI9_ARUDO